MNVNRADDANTLHIHNPDELSAIYYVAAGEGRRSPSTTKAHATAHTDGCLLFRGGPRAGLPLGAASHAGAHTYMRVEPEPGVLWIFAGGIPHLVMGMQPSQQEPEGPRMPRSHTLVPTQERHGQGGREPPWTAESLAQHEAERQAGWKPRISIAVNFFEASVYAVVSQALSGQTSHADSTAV